ncbi:hypothetical protein ROA7450_03360 [Roseovarius albus]|uniref:Uncharacterized protein n=1 Tax=Roseovarius albus TaxID=1247867 RepID=A0A1X6ZWR5_9RHOB|nr:hypothetical protein [Roseovarius albus]SLN63922.1 hypothetical protein ROA7450_03360 [Roseovarius albus]
MNALALETQCQEASFPDRPIDLMDDIHESAWRVRGLTEAISLVREEVPAIYSNTTQSALVTATLHALEAEAATLEGLANTIYDKLSKPTKAPKLQPVTQDPHAGWLAQWHEENARWHKAAQGHDEEHNEPEKEAAEDEKVRLANLIGRTKAQTLEGVLVQIEYWLIDYGDYLWGRETPDVIEAVTLHCVRDGIKGFIKKGDAA